MKSFFLGEGKKGKKAEEGNEAIRENEEELREISEMEFPQEQELEQGTNLDKISFSLRGFKGHLTRNLEELEVLIENMENMDLVFCKKEINDVLTKIENHKDKIVSIQLLLLRLARDVNEGQKYTKDITDTEQRVEMAAEKAKLCINEIDKRIKMANPITLTSSEGILGTHPTNHPTNQWENLGARPKEPRVPAPNLRMPPPIHFNSNSTASNYEIPNNPGEMRNPFCSTPINFDDRAQNFNPENATNFNNPFVSHNNPFTWTDPIQQDDSVNRIANAMTQALGINYNVKLDVPESFSGDEINVEEAYQKFSNRWQNAVARMKSLNKTEGEILRSLKNCLTGTALRAIETIPECPGNLDTAVNLLSSLYSNRQKLARDIINNLVEMRPAQGGDLQALRSVYTCLIEAQQNLINFDISESEFSRLVFISFVEKKLPTSVRDTWLKKLTELNAPHLHTQKVFVPSLNQFFKCLFLQMQKLSTISSSKTAQPSSLNNPAQNRRQINNSTNNTSSIKTTYAITAQQPRIGTAPLPCPFCGLHVPSHRPYNCKKLLQLPVKERWGLIRASHPYNDCSVKCTICGG